ncbi:MAG: cysteine-rich CWC family protein [Pyrinomonadaceae bacterium]
MNDTLVKIGSALTQVLNREKVCESCGNEFSCGASLSGCWCSQIDLSDESRAGLRSRYRDCLCRDCLTLLSRSSKS